MAIPTTLVSRFIILFVVALVSCLAFLSISSFTNPFRDNKKEMEAANNNILTADLALLTTEERERLAKLVKSTRREVEVVIAAYDEDISWAEMYSSIAVVYSKSEAALVPSHFNNVHRIPNVGRETHTYLHHIVQNYDRLANLTVFAQGSARKFGFLNWFIDQCELVV